MVIMKAKPRRITWKTVLKRMNNPERQSYLNEPEAYRIVPAEIRSNTLRQLQRLKRRLDKDAPTPAWFDAVWSGVETMPEGFIRCNCCHRLTPPQCVGSSGGCDDCRLSGMSPSELAHLPSSRSQCWIVGELIRHAVEKWEDSHRGRECPDSTRKWLLRRILPGL